MTTAKSIIDKFNLTPHKEGGFYKKTYQSDATINLNNNTIRHINTAIYYLLESDDFSCWHRLKSDEMWHYYCGSDLTIYQINQHGHLTRNLLGNPLKHKNACPQYTVPSNKWFAATVNESNSFSLLGCTVSPGFDDADFEMGERKELLLQ